MALRHRLRSKYGVSQAPGGKLARTVDGILFDSLAEARRYRELRMLETAGQIRGLMVQPAYELNAPVVVKAEVIGQARLGIYRADFRYEAQQQGYWIAVIEDVKGCDLQMGKWKRRHAEAQYGIEVTLIKARR